MGTLLSPEGRAAIQRAADDAGQSFEEMVRAFQKFAVALTAHERAVREDELRKTADAWSQGAWAETPRRADIVQDRMAAANYVGNWLRHRANAIESEATDE